MTALADTRPSFARLTGVELRKMVDTRAGFWLQAAIAALTLTVVTLFCIFADTQDQTFKEMIGVALAPSMILLPIVGILLVSSEWSQRTALITFTLVPHRSRILSAKLAAGVTAGLIAMAICLLVAVVANAAIGGEWALGAALFGQVVLLVLTGMVTGIAFGALFLSSAPAIVLSFVLPLAWAALGSLSFLNGAAQWLDTTRTTEPMMQRTLDGTEWAQVGTSLALWMVLPLLIGGYRILKGEIRSA
jgi:ABC-type transport system involved in multi-copper enzyme maturation permease subunit